MDRLRGWEGTVQIPPDQRPVRLKFGTMHGRHLFLKYAKVLRQAGFKVDDDLTPLQQQERRFLEEDAETLRTKGYLPFLRGSQLHYFHKEKMHTCRKGNASSLPSAGLAAELSYARKIRNASLDKILGALSSLFVTDLKDGPYRLGKALRVKLYV